MPAHEAQRALAPVPEAQLADARQPHEALVCPQPVVPRQRLELHVGQQPMPPS